ncbi:ATPase [Thalassobaculum fulvum]|uniref:histidine kinase n=1 Tax=Thalassobaculum fulvum TaxID=1633335 RepID=A0A919CMM7_9PROT|nr:ActS/PrrB/RegB family redox-sensitive histidine kinase [Thalassobaculum fulvum]GHD40387.1 ATPase [Thalassobaculum fulvum]
MSAAEPQHQPQHEAPDEPPDRAPPDRAAPSTVTARTLAAIRWVALGGQLATLLVVHFGFGFPLPLALALAIVAVSAALNLTLLRRRPGRDRLDEREAAFYLGFDILQLAALLFVTGGLGNPFALLLLAPVTVSATILTRRSTIHLCTLALACATALAFAHLPLPWLDEQGFKLPAIYTGGLWVALVVALVFNAAYAWWVAEEARRISAALAATQEALARQQRLAAVGALAAAAAHELGSPLGTIAVVARELARELPPGSDLAEDAQLLLSESQRCRDILASLARRSDPEPHDSFAELPFDALVEQAAEPHQRDGVAVIVEAHAPDGAPVATRAPVVRPTPELLHGLGSIIQNAVQFASATVEITVGWSDDGTLSVEVEDDGPGFAPSVLSRLGEPYVSTRAGRDGHMGLGLFIARTLLERTGAEVGFANRADGGARVDVRWPDGLRLDPPR